VSRTKSISTKKKGKKMLSKLGTLATETQAIKKQIRETAQSKLKPALKGSITDLIAIVPTLTAIRWHQYTPYFNDGDACTFSVNSPEFQFGEGESFVDSYSLDDEDLNKTQVEAIEEFETELGDCEELLEEAFGDHVEVTVTTTGIETESYEHD